MPRAAIVYFSQGGTTARVAEAIGAGLRSAGYVVDFTNLRDGPLPDVGTYDLLGIGSPVYYYRLPFNVADCLGALPRLENKAAFGFLVHGSHAFDAGDALRHAFAERGARDVGCFRCHGEAHFLGHLREGYLFSPDHPTRDELDRATAFGVAVGQGAASGSQVPAAAEPEPPLVCRIERAATSRWLVEHVYSRLFKVDPGRCTACGLCMEVCPTRNVGKDAHGRPTWGRRCLYCLSCEMKCPEDAISSAISRPVFRTLARPFLRYNVSHWAREPDLDHVRVVHSHGRTERRVGE
jgi:flavodoxin/ferredoxin